MAVDVSKRIIGFVSGFEEGKGRTGYQIKMLVRGMEHTFDCTEEAYQLRYTDKYFPYPCLGEVLFMPHFDERNVIVEMEDVNDMGTPEGVIPMGISMGTMRMFQKKLTPETPAFGDILEFADGKVTFKKFTEYNQSDKDMGENMDDTICAMLYRGMPKPYTGMELKVAPDCVIYYWDWSVATTPFHICSREEALANNFVQKFEIGSVEDIKRSYWVGMFSTRGEEGVIDLIKCFPNKVPGWCHPEEVEQYCK